MRIGFDAKRAFLNATGLGNFSRNWIRALSEHYPEHDYVLFTPRAAGADGSWLPAPAQAVLPRGAYGLLPGWWRRSGISREIIRQGLAVFHGLSNELPAGLSNGPVRPVVTVHDVIFARYPQWYARADRWMYDYKTRQACRDAAAIHAISHETADDLNRLYGVRADRITVIYQAVHPCFFGTDAAADVPAGLTLPSEFLLYVGTLEPRKQVLAAVRALHRLPASLQLPMVVVGAPRPYWHRVRKTIALLGMTRRIIHLPALPLQGLAYLYRRASVLVYPSEAEGFGLPIAEALASGLPVVANDRPALREAGGPSTLYASASDAEAFAAALSRALTDSALRQQMTEQGRKYAQQFMPSAVARRAMSWYESVL